MPTANRDQIGITLHQPDHVVWDAEPIGEDLRKRRLVSLPDGLCPGDPRHRAVRLEADIDILARRATSTFDVVGETEPAQQPAALAVAAAHGKDRHISNSERTI